MCPNFFLQYTSMSFIAGDTSLPETKALRIVGTTVMFLLYSADTHFDIIFIRKK